MKVENYIEGVYRKLTTYKNIEYENLYESFKNQKLVEIFSTIHHLLIFNFEKMNSRLPTEIGPVHFWADNSRQLILAIESAKGLQRALNKSKYMFRIDPYYEEVMTTVYKFLSDSGGSEIPFGIEKIEPYYTIPLFEPIDALRFDSLNETLNAELKMIGEGSYAFVYKYKDPFYNKFFVVKRAKSELNDKELERFQREYESMKNFKSPYIVEVYKYDENKQEYYMEFMDLTLEKYINLNNSKLTLEKRKGICRQILRAFQYIHTQDNFHRDISPNNILVKTYDDTDVIKVSDFGLIKTPDSQLTSLWTEFKGSFNDPSLIIDGFHTYGISHETFALTRIIAYVLTGKTNLDTIDDPNLKKFIEKGLASDKEKRFQNVDEMNDYFNKL